MVKNMDSEIVAMSFRFHYFKVTIDIYIAEKGYKDRINFNEIK